MTKYLEDYVAEINRAIQNPTPHVYRIVTEWPEIFLQSISEQLEQDRTLTTRQTSTVITIIKKMFTDKSFPSSFRGDIGDLMKAIKENRWRDTPRVSVERRREARYIGANHVLISGVSGIPKASTSLSKMRAMYRDKMAIVSVTRYNIDELITFLGNLEMEIDETLEEFLALCLGSKNKISHFIATGEDCAVNICDDETLAIFIRHFCDAEDL